MRFQLLAFCVLVTLFVACRADDDERESDNIPYRDVCVLGAGASGMSSAVWLKDRGYSVVVLEKSSAISGHCDTRFFSAPAGSPNWIDIGVQVFPNTSLISQLGFPSWKVSSADFINRFSAGGAEGLGDYVASLTAYVADFSTGFYLGPTPASQPPTAYYAALGRFQEQLMKYASWLDYGPVPFPVPSDLTLKFSDFVAKYQLEPLLSSFFAPQLFGGGLGSFSKLTTLYAMRNLSPSILAVFSTPGGAMAVKGGCDSIYQGIKNYLGADNVITNADTQYAFRSKAKGPPPKNKREENARVLISGRRTNMPAGSDCFSYQCGSLFVSFPQLPSATGFLNFDNKEKAIFGQATRRYYFAALIEIEGSLATGSNLYLTNANLADPYLFAQLPAVHNIARKAASGPFSSVASSDNPITVAEMTTVYEQTLARLKAVNPTVISNYRILEVKEHVFQAHPTDAALKKGFYRDLDALQGHRNTFYTGALVRYPASHLLWEHSYRLVDQFFADKKGNSNASDYSTVYGGAAAGGSAALLAAVGIFFVRRRKMEKKSRQEFERRASENMQEISSTSAADDAITPEGIRLENVSRAYETILK